MAERHTDAENKELAELLFPKLEKTVEEWILNYPARNLPAGAMVTRVAPSPTGFMHIGGVYMAMVCRKLSRQTGGVFFLRIEDTDAKREVEGAKLAIVRALAEFDLMPDEGPFEKDGALDEKGAYGPYTQSHRAALYQSFAKKLVQEGKAYPCFATEAELAASRTEQESLKIRPGYYSRWALWRDRSFEDIKTALSSGVPYALRLRSDGVEGKTVTVEDLMRGNIEIQENDQDIVLLKADGIPTYHFAHAVDDHLMGTTHIIRGDEWLSSTPVHFELFAKLGFPAPHYAHAAPIQKIGEGGGKRKLSKRKDPEATAGYYPEKGYPARAVIEYLMNLANSGFEDWRKANPTASYDAFELSLEKFNRAGPLFDEVKLRDISKRVIAEMTTDEAFAALTEWAEKYNVAFAALIAEDELYTKRILSIERGDATARKDLAAWSDAPIEFGYFFDAEFKTPELQAMPSLLTPTETKAALQQVIASYDSNDERDVWFAKLKAVAATFGLAGGLKELKAEPEKYRGQVGELAGIIRYALSGKTRTQDLHAVMRAMGTERALGRLSAYAGKL